MNTSALSLATVSPLPLVSDKFRLQTACAYSFAAWLLATKVVGENAVSILSVIHLFFGLKTGVVTCSRLYNGVIQQKVNNTDVQYTIIIIPAFTNVMPHQNLRKRIPCQ